MNKKWITAVLLLMLSLSLILGGCRKQQTEPTDSSTQQPTQTTAEEATEEVETTEETEPEMPSIQAGRMKSHPNGANGNTGIYFTMDPNDVPHDSSWKTEFKPASISVVQLIRDGQTYNVGNYMTGMVVKYSATEYYLKTEAWVNKKYFPLQNGDIIKVEGAFKNSELEVSFTIDTSYILYEEGLVFFSDKYPDSSMGARVVTAGPMTGHPNGKNSNGIYATMEKNAAPVTDWSVEYKAVSEDVIKLIRDGKTYNIGNPAAGRLIKFGETEYFLKMEKWIIKDLYPLRDGDIVVVNGKFANSTTGMLINVKKTYIAFQEGLLSFSTEYPSGDSAIQAVKIDTMQPHPNGKNANGIYFSAPENDISVDTTWATEFMPASADVIKLIRDGQTYSIANVDAGTIIKFRDTEYFLKLEQWMYKEHFPFVDGDILVIEGRFLNAGVGQVFEIGKTYVAFQEGILKFSTEYPSADTAVQVEKIDAIAPHPNGKTATGVYFSAPENTITADNTWATEYVPASADVIKLIRNGQTYSIGNVNAGTIIKYKATEYFLKLDQWMYKEYFPFVDGDILVVEGRFLNAGMGEIFEIGKTYISFQEGILKFSTEYPSAESGVQVVKIDTISPHPKGKEQNGVYFTAPENAISVDTTWATEFVPANADVIKLIRNGQTYSIGNVNAGTIVKFRDTEYFLKLDQWMYKEHFPFVDGDILVVEGRFLNAGMGEIFEIGKTYISFQAGILKFSTEYPSADSGVNVVKIDEITNHPNGRNQNGIHFCAPENAISVDTTWVTEFMPASADVIKLIRNGQTYSIGNVNAGTIVKFRDTEYFLKLDQWMYKEQYPFVDGDILVLEGCFLNAGLGEIFEFSKTYITLYNGKVMFTKEYPTEIPGDDTIYAGAFTSHPKGVGSDGVYATMAENTAPFKADWTLEYTPVSADAYKLIRDGQTYDIGIPGRGTIVKFRETEYYLKTGWNIGDYAPMQDGDILVVEGKFVNAASGAVMSVDKTYIAFSGGMAAFSTEYPSGDSDVTVIEGGSMSSHPNGWTSEGIHFTLAENAVPVTDWSVEYKPLKADVIKLIRNGNTYSIGNMDAGTIIKFNETGYFWKTEKWMFGENYPIVDGDVLVVEGNFVNAGNGVVFSIAKTYITVENGQLIFSTDAPDVIQAGPMSSHPNGWNTAANDGLYFKLGANEVPYDGWNVEYCPSSAANIKLTRDTQTYNIGIPSRGTIVKYSDTEYYLKLGSWTIGDYFPIKPGDVLTVEGKFANETNGTVFAISKTVITVGENYLLQFAQQESESDVIQAGPMSAYDESWNFGKTGFYFSMAENAVPADSTGITEYYPLEAASIKLLRSGSTTQIAIAERGTIVKYDAQKYFLKLDKWTVGDYAPIVAGDVLTVEGIFTNAANGVTFQIEKTQITVAQDYSLTFGETVEQPTGKPMFAHPNGWNSENIYATMEVNDAPYDGWSLRYNPQSADVIKVIRGGQTYSVANPDAETLVKFSETEYDIVTWMFGDKKPQAGDVIIIEGVFTNKASGKTIEVSKTVITLNADGTATFASESGTEPEPEPEQPTGQPMLAHPNGWNTDNIYATMAVNDAPYDGWSLRYNPQSADVIKVIRDGQTYSVGNPDAETLVKYSETEYDIVTWMFGDKKPKAGDVFIIEGVFTNKASGKTIEVSKTLITLNADGTATFESEGGTEPEQPTKIQAGNMLAWDEQGFNTATNGGLWFTMENGGEIPADPSWVLEYTPVSADVIQLVRNGNTTDIAIPERGTLVKVDDAEYYLKLEWNIGDYANTVTVGDVLIVEGDFTNATNGVTFTVSKTYIAIGEDYALSFSKEAPAAPGEEGVIQAGNMASHSSGLTSTFLFFTMAENDAPAHLTKAIYKPMSASAIQLVRDGVTYDIADPEQTAIQKTTKSNYKLKLSTLAADLLPLQDGDLLIFDGKFTGGNTNTGATATFRIARTYVAIVDGAAVFSDTQPTAQTVAAVKRNFADVLFSVLIRKFFYI